jgi:hypothetical protein
VFERPHCVVCGASAPETNTDQTLISATFGWRLTRQALPDGSRALEWRCPSCWKRQKALQAMAKKP